MDNILLTGASGFLGGILATSISKKTITLGRHASDHVRTDLVNEVGAAFPEGVKAVVHCAGKAHVLPKNELEADDFFKVNYNGTRNLCLWIEKWPVLPKVFVFISTVAVYGVESGEMIAEDAPLLGDTPYARSKIDAEEFLADWCRRAGVRLVILRLPLVAGTNPPGNLGAMIKAIRMGYYFRIGAGGARRSMVLANDIALALPDILKSEGTFNLTDGQHPSFAELDTYMAAKLSTRVKVIPQSMANVLAKIGDRIPGSPFNSNRLSKMSSTLTFCDRKARETFSWSAQPVIGNLDI